MASNEFITRFKNKTFLLGKAGLLPVINQNAINKSVVPSSKLHITSETDIRRPLNERPTPPPISRNILEKVSKATVRSYSKSPIPLFPNTQRSKSPIFGSETQDYLRKNSGFNKFPRISSGTGIDVVKILKN